MRPPKIKAPFLINSTFDFARDVIGFLEKARDEHDGICRFKVSKYNVVYVTKPEYIQHVLQKNNRNYTKAEEYDELKHLLGQGLLTSEGEFWLRQRRLAAPAFYKDSLQSFVQTMVRYTNEMLHDWEKKDKIEITSQMSRLTLGIAGETLLSRNLLQEAGAVGRAITYLIEATNERILGLFTFPLWAPTPKNLKYKKERAIVDEVIFDIINERLRKGETGTDLLGMLMAVQDEDTGEKMSLKQLKDETMTIFIAGHETTALALTWIFYLLSKNPGAAQKLLAEQEAVLGDRESEFEDLKKLTYTTQVIEEAMRLYPPAWLIARNAIEDDEVDGYTIRKGENVFICPYTMHHHPDYWNDPEKFDPERFAPGKRKAIDKFVYLPFGSGPRICIGNNFAMMEMQIVLSVICRKYRLKYNGPAPEKKPLITLRPKQEVVMELEKINTSQKVMNNV